MRRDELQSAGGPAWLFDTFTNRRAGAPRRNLEGLFDVVALPGERLQDSLLDGDVVIHRALAEGVLAELVEAGSSGLRPGARLPLDQIVLRPSGLIEQPAPAPAPAPAPVPAPAPDTAVANRFIAAHATRFCTPGQAGSLTCQGLPAPRPIRRVVIHALAVPSTPQRSGIEAVVAGWQNAGREASSHYLVDRDGTITQMVREAHVAFHTPANNADSIGIEHADVCNDPAPYTTRLYERSAELVRDIARRHGIALGNATVAGHQDVNPNHGDPGPYWDWEYYRLLLAWDGVTAASRPVRVVAAAASRPAAPAGWQTAQRRAIANDRCAERRDPWGVRYWRAQPAAAGAAAELALLAAEAGVYSVSLWWPDVQGANRAVNVEIETGCIANPCRQTSAPVPRATVDQRHNFGRWNVVGFVTIDGPPAEVRVRIRRDSARPGWILCDGARLLRVGSCTAAAAAAPGAAGEWEAFAESVSCAGPARVLDRFASDKADLTADHRAVLARLAREIVESQSGSGRVEGVCLVGHADTKGADAYNLELAGKRAANAETELRLQIDALSPGLSVRLAFDRSSRGESAPVASDATPEGRARNRRVEISLRRRPAEPASTTTRRTSTGSRSGVEAFESFAEQSSKAPQIVLIGPEGVEFTGTGRPLPLGAPAYSWGVLDPKVARASQVIDSQEHANRVTVFGLRPGQTTLRQLYRSEGGGIATDDTPLVVTRIGWKTLLVPEGRVEPGANELSRWGLNISPARRAVVVQLEPASFWAGKRVEWSFRNPVIRGFPGDEPTLELQPGFDYSALTRKSVIGPDGTAGVLVKVPAVPFNRVRLAAAAESDPLVRAELLLEVPGIVIVDPGHGGARKVGGSSPNNARGPVTRTLEKELTLSMGLRVRDALLADPRLVRVTLTRECDVNVGIEERALLAQCRGADVFVSIHFNGGEKTTRGTSTFVRANSNGNVNRDEDVALARRVQDAVVAVIPGGANAGGGDGIFDDTASQDGSLGVLNDTSLGNTRTRHPIRSCLVEVEFLSNDEVDRMFNRGDWQTLRQNVAEAIAGAIVADLASRT